MNFILLLQLNTITDSINSSQIDKQVVEEKTLSILELITSGGTGGNLIMITLAILSILSV